MFNFGIEGYQAQWLNGLSAITAAHGRRLQALVGRRLTQAWLIRDCADGEWFADGPVLLDFDGEQAEINHQKFHDLSVTWNSVDPKQAIHWPTCDDFNLEWREDLRPELAALRGQALSAVELLEWTGPDLAHGMVAIDFIFTASRLTVFNALDENGLAFDPPGHGYTGHSLIADTRT